MMKKRLTHSLVLVTLTLLTWQTSAWAINTPSPSAPSNGTTIQASSQLSWSFVPGAAQYRVCFNYNSTNQYAAVISGCGLITPFIQGGSSTSYTVNQQMINQMHAKNWGGHTIGWKVQACNQQRTECSVCDQNRTDGNQQQCNKWRTVAVAGMGAATGGSTNFSTLLAKTFRHARCIVCHRFEITKNPAYKGRKGSQAWHIASGRLADNANIHQSSNCSGCHTQAANWHAPDKSFEFRGLSNKQLCQKTRVTPGTTAEQHLKFDSLIIWAVDSGQLPENVQKSKAPPRSASAWRAKVDQWVAGGMSCEDN